MRCRKNPRIFCRRGGACRQPVR